MSTEQNPNPSTAPDPTVEPQNDPQDGPNREAAMRRRQLREVEAERDALRSRLDDRDRRDVDQMAAERLADSGDLWLSTSLDAMRAEDGTIDMEKAEAELQRVVTEKPHWAKQEPTPHPVFPHGVRTAAPEPPSPPSFGQTVKRALRGG